MTEGAVRKLAKIASSTEEFCTALKSRGVDTYSKPGDCCVSFSVDTTTRAESGRTAEDRFGKTHYISCFSDDERTQKSHKV